MFTEIANLKKNEETSRIGAKWSNEEVEELMKELIDKKSYEEIALNHKRTIGGIKSRVICLILYLQYKDKSKTIEELSLEYNIENDLVLKYINKMKIKDSNESTIVKYIDKKEIKDSEIKTKVNIEILYDKIVSLENKMLSIEQKLDNIIYLNS
jgi:NifB/MoaA-like Fe-S oxidoreductase